MKISLDYANNLGYIQFKPDKIEKSLNFEDKFVFDLNSQNEIVGLELLTLNSSLPIEKLSQDESIGIKELEALQRLAPGIASSYQFGFSADSELELRNQDQLNA